MTSNIANAPIFEPTVARVYMRLTHRKKSLMYHNRGNSSKIYPQNKETLTSVNQPTTSSNKRDALPTRQFLVHRDTPTTHLSNTHESSECTTTSRSNTESDGSYTPSDIIIRPFICPLCKLSLTSASAHRHIQTHKRQMNDISGVGWRCKGVPLELASAYGVPRSSPIYNHRNNLRTGGCLKTFSRRDALKRHIITHKGCFGHATRDDAD